MSVLNEAGPLAGIKVVDWTHVLAGPFCGYQLALLGADVIRIERPDGDDLIRVSAADPALGALGLGETFITQGGGKRSLAIDARDERAKQILARLIARADVLVENFRPGKLAALGFDPAQLIVKQPNLVVCSITGFGAQSKRRAYDHVVQAASGLMMANANAAGVPQRVGFPLVDYAVGQQAAMAIITALYRRESQRHAGRIRTEGEWLNVTMAGAALTLMAPAYAEALVSGRERPKSSSTAFSGSPLSGTFQVADGFIALVCNAKNQTTALAAMLADAGADEQLLHRLDAAVAVHDVAQAQDILASIFRLRTADDWDQRFASWGVPGTPVRKPVQAAMEAAASWPTVRLPVSSDGEERIVPVPGVGFTSTQALTPSLLRSPARRGQDTAAILRELGTTAQETEELLTQKVIFAP